MVDNFIAQIIKLTCICARQSSNLTRTLCNTTSRLTPARIEAQHHLLVTGRHCRSVCLSSMRTISAVRPGRHELNFAVEVMSIREATSISIVINHLLFGTRVAPRNSVAPSVSAGLP